MSSLSALEKRTLEKLLGMETGYVHNFSNRTFRDFFLDTVKIDIEDPKYHRASGSKAHRLRQFWTVEDDGVVARALGPLLDMVERNSGASAELTEARTIVERLQRGGPVPHADALVPNEDDSHFDALARSVHACIGENRPQDGLDRLHTFVVKFVRVLCRKRGIATDQDKPLHSIFGEYVKALEREGLLDSEMTKRILKSTISILDAFNDVRNHQSFAHDNPLLNHREALLIFNNVAGVVFFLSALENTEAEVSEGE